MTAWIILGAILLFFVFLLSLKATITVGYSDEVTLSIRVLFVKIKLLPKKTKKGPHSMSAKKAEKLRKKAAKAAAKKKEAKRLKAEHKLQKKEAEKDKPKKSMSEILDMISLIRELVAVVIRRFFGHLRIRVTRLKLVVATPDAATTAIAYGAACTAINLLLPTLSEVKNFKLPAEDEFGVVCDFTADTPSFDVKLSFSLRVWHLFHVAFGALGRFISRKLRQK